MKFLLDHECQQIWLSHCARSVTRAIRSIEVLPPTASDKEVWAHGCAHELIVITCNRNDYLALAGATDVYAGLIIMKRRRTRQAEASRVLTLLKRAGEQGLANNINFA